jgi:hypothetical protein
MNMKKLGSIAFLALAVALIASPAAASASPVKGLWGGSETKYWMGGKWVSYSEQVPFSFVLQRGKVVSFKPSSTYVWPRCAGGKTVSAKLPATRQSTIRHGRFRGRRTTHAGSRKMTMYVSGHFSSARRAAGKIVVKLAGCPDYRSLWAATSGGLAIHIPMCRGQNVELEDGSYYYNPCAYVAKTPEGSAPSRP